MPWRALAFLFFVAVFAYFGFVDLTGVAALIARAFFVLFLLLLFWQAIHSGARSCARREMLEHTSRIDS